MLGIIAAMEKEITELKGLMQSEGSDVTVQKIAGMEFYQGRLFGHELTLVTSGIGKVNAAVAAEILIAVFNVRGIINTGIAGSLDNRIDIGDIVLSTDALEHDMDVTGLGYEKGVCPDQEVSIYPADEELRGIALEACRRVCSEVKVFEGRVVSGDQFISDKKVKDDIVASFGGMCTEMEGAAIAHTAWLSKVPYLVIRSISDKADDSAEMDYPSFQKLAIENETKIITEIIRLID